VVSALEDDPEGMMSTGNSTQNLKTQLSCYRNFYSNSIIILWNHYINA